MNFDVPLSPSTRLAAPSDSQPGAGHAQPSASLARSKRPGAAVLCALALAASLAACSRQDAAPAAAAKAAPEVGVVTLQKQSQQLEATLPGRTRASLTAEVRPQIGDADWARVHFLGKLPHERFVDMLRVSRLHLYLTYPFVLSWSLLEAMSVGCAIVASDTAPVREAIIDNETGRLVDFFDVNAWSSQVIDLCNQPQQRKQLGAAAQH